MQNQRSHDETIKSLREHCTSGFDLQQEMYEQPRQRANLAMMSGLDSLSWIYRPQKGFVAGLRGLGLGLINSSSTAKQQIMKYAMGL